MKQFAAGLWRVLKGLPLAVLAIPMLAVSALALLLTDIAAGLFKGFGSSPRRPDSSPRKPAARASIVIPNWNGKDLLEKYLPSVIASIRNHPGSEVIVVDNGSTDGSASFLRERFPGVRLLALAENLGFGGGSNAGFRAAVNDVVVLLNSDMRVESDFLAPLLEGFSDPAVFAVSCQILFSDAAKPREETGLTEGWWSPSGLGVGHRIGPEISDLYPCFYGGGGSCAFDRSKFLELGGFDELLRPFYLEDTDLGYMAWKRGWKVYYQPRSIVHHEHRGTIGKHFTREQIQGVLRKNYLLFTWKNIHEWSRLSTYFFFTWAGATLSWLVGDSDSPDRANSAGILRAFLQLPGAMHSRWSARHLSVISDAEAFRRPLAGHFRDCFAELPCDPKRLSVLFVSPYPICPPVHGGGVFMYQTIRELTRLCDVHLIALLDHEGQRAAHEELDQICASTEYVVRMKGASSPFGSIQPHAVGEFRSQELAWLIHRQIYLHKIDVVQLEYTVLGQYAGQYRRIPSILFEHDVYFQSIGRRLPFMTNAVEKLKARWEYLRSLRYELNLLPKADRVQVCSEENADYIRSFLPELANRLDPGYRAGIDTSSYDFKPAGREPFTLLFLGSFRHLPNQEAIQWFTTLVLPRVQQREPRVRLVVIGSDPPPRHSLPENASIDLIGFVEDVREPLSRYALFICPILSGSGVRVKLLEAFSAGIPVVSTTLGAEGLATQDGDVCALADDPQAFADRIVELLQQPEHAEAMAHRARAHVVATRDMRVMTEKLVESYRSEVRRMRLPAS